MNAKDTKTTINSSSSANDPVQEISKDRGSLPIVGIGASAGGLEALEELFGNMPIDSGIAFVVVTHLDPQHRSLLPEILAKKTPFKVVELKDGEKLGPDTIYIAPPAKNLVTMDGCIHFGAIETSFEATSPIDSFFRSLAEDHGDSAICIILSGSGSDGAIGLKTIKGESGLVIVQNPQSAKFAGMPNSAIDTGMVDMVLDASKIPDALIKYISGPYLKTSAGLGGRNIGPSLLECLPTIFQLLRVNTGNDFSLYKTNTIRRRIERRMNLKQIDDPKKYVDILKDSHLEVDTLFKELLIGVTSFFRDKDAFNALSKKVIPGLLRQKNDDSVLRVWVAGCSTGEEAYSMAIILKECLEDLGKNMRLQIFATDLDKEAIEIARTGVFSSGIAVDISPERLKRYFIKEESRYRVRKDIRELIIFAGHNIIKDPPFTKVDIVSCRNLLIYLESELQKRLLPLFHYALLSSGILFLGSSETIGSFGDLYEPIDLKRKIFRKKSTPSSFRHPSDEFTIFAIQDGKSPAKTISTKKTPKMPQIGDEVNQLLISVYCPPSVITTNLGDIIYTFGRTGEFLEPAQGEANLNVLNMARPGLRLELATGLRKATTQSEEVVYDNVYVQTNGNKIPVTLSIRSITQPGNLKGLILICFNKKKFDAIEGGKDSNLKIIDQQRSQSEELERELQFTRESLQSTIEELETSNEELKSTNEELQSTNEELQSTNEELETSKEEMQLLNEELQTVNSELQSKLEDLSQANDDMKNLLNSTDIATIFLDNDLRIKRFTEEAKKVINVINTDIGRPVTDIVSNLDHHTFAEEAKEVLGTLIFKESEVITKDGCWYLMRILPYRTADNKIDGLVITFVDIDTLKKAKDSLKETEERWRSLVECSPFFILIVSMEGIIMFANKVKGRSLRENLLGSCFFDLIEPSHQSKIKEIFIKLKKVGEVVGCHAPLMNSGADLYYDIQIAAMRRDGSMIGAMVVVNELKTKQLFNNTVEKIES